MALSRVVALEGKGQPRWQCRVGLREGAEADMGRKTIPGGGGGEAAGRGEAM